MSEADKERYLGCSIQTAKIYMKGNLHCNVDLEYSELIWIRLESCMNSLALTLIFILHYKYSVDGAASCARGLREAHSWLRPDGDWTVYWTTRCMNSRWCIPMTDADMSKLRRIWRRFYCALARLIWASSSRPVTSEIVLTSIILSATRWWRRRRYMGHWWQTDLQWY